jgi:hypothetical protein
MLIINLSDCPNGKSCGSIARQLIKQGQHSDQLIRFYRGTTKVFNEDLTLGYWAGTRVKESTDGEWMKTVSYANSFQRHTPRQMDSEVGLMV